ncbi:Peptidyl-prolyl cis-trans isomerase CWC27-like protein [Auxenochlorella protothecoides]|uniref:Peptidyl-prolyl cis-trans isomerase CWC27-like protein n=2 Tax=Auxenochlorella protothecoides TaxID=3075 RepID=A0A087SPT2_AUXPR|nr:Peptidyl-prolyl cis-trans isomerase CWC27-like protein [Auxenochlorella protothecoides]KFM27736.1 Peptidyl-prolyl cis-trans isomerase CWC27-like protein [Auxenochlorella protothecoides]
MSNVYNLEPPTKGKAVLRTSLGDLDVELWAKEAPKAVRNFVQLCLEGYYDGTIFHRVLKDFMAQGGDPTGTGQGGESIYGRPFKDEVHSRLRFTHRGLLACANQNKPDTNGSQFFITLDATPQLERKYTIFGRVAGDTLYNLLRFNDLEVGEDDRPEHPPVLKRADVLWNPFDDIVPRVDREAREAEAAEAAAAAAARAKTLQRKAAKNFSLISFGDEAEAEEEAAVEAAASLKIASAHDALHDAHLSKEAALDVDLNRRVAGCGCGRFQLLWLVVAAVAGGRSETLVREALRSARQRQEEEAPPSTSAAPAPQPSDLESRMRERVQARRAAKASEGEGRPGQNQSPSGSGGEEDEEDGDASEEDGRPRRRAARSLAGTGQGKRSTAAVVVPSRQIAVADANLLSSWEKRRKEYLERKRIGGSRQRDTLSKLQRFTSNLRSAAGPGSSAGAEAGPSTDGVEAAGPGPDGAAAAAPASQDRSGAPEGATPDPDFQGYDGRVRQDIAHEAYMPAAWRVDAYLGKDGEDESDDDLASLRKHRLAFVKDARDAMARKESVEDYTVHDPLLEAGKAKFNKKSQAERKRGNQWAGRANN